MVRKANSLTHTHGRCQEIKATLDPKQEYGEPYQRQNKNRGIASYIGLIVLDLRTQTSLNTLTSEEKICLGWSWISLWSLFRAHHIANEIATHNSPSSFDKSSSMLLAKHEGQGGKRI